MGHDKGQEGEGGGFGVTGHRPGAGTVIREDGEVSWRPAVNFPTRWSTIVGLVVMAYLISRPPGWSAPSAPPHQVAARAARAMAKAKMAA